VFLFEQENCVYNYKIEPFVIHLLGGFVMQKTSLEH